MKLRFGCAMLGAFFAPVLWGQTAECSPYAFVDVWRLSVTITDSTPGPAAVMAIDTIINNGTLFELGTSSASTIATAAITKSGEILSGITERQANGQWNFFFGPAPRYAYLCTIGFKSYSLLEAKGAPFGSRITRYTITVDPNNTGNVSGTVQYESHDMTGAVINVVNGTFTGMSVAHQADIDGDPYWSALRTSDGRVGARAKP
jgi:hypothetical protein